MKISTKKRQTIFEIIVEDGYTKMVEDVAEAEKGKHDEDFWVFKVKKQTIDQLWGAIEDCLDYNGEDVADYIWNNFLTEDNIRRLRVLIEGYDGEEK